MHSSLTEGKIAVEWNFKFFLKHYMFCQVKCCERCCIDLVLKILRYHYTLAFVAMDLDHFMPFFLVHRFCGVDMHSLGSPMHCTLQKCIRNNCLCLDVLKTKVFSVNQAWQKILLGDASVGIPFHLHVKIYVCTF